MNAEKIRNVIMDNYQNPYNYQKKHDGYQMVNTKNNSCIDNINLYIKWNNDVIDDISFDGEACAISISSTSIMIKNLVGKTKVEALKYIDSFDKMLNCENFDKDLLKDAIVFKNMGNQGNRKICAYLPLMGMKKAILEK